MNLEQNLEHNIDEVIKTIQKLSGLFGKEKKMVEFLIKNFNRDNK